MPKKKETVREKGIELEKRTETWLKRKFGCEITERNILLRGKTVRRGYEIDVHGIKKKFLGGQVDYIVECKAFKVKRAQVMNFASKLEDIKEAFENDMEKWVPDYAIMVSDVGFDTDAIEMAKKYHIGCYEATEKGFKEIVTLEELDC